MESTLKKSKNKAGLDRAVVGNEGRCGVIKNDLSVDSFDFTVLEMTLLSTIRFICCVTSGMGNACWKENLQKVEKLGAPFPPDMLVGSAFCLVQAIMKDRARPFAFMSSQCKSCGRKITKDELDVMWLLRASHGDNKAELKIVAQCVSGCNDTKNIEEAAENIGVLMQAITYQIGQTERAGNKPIGQTIH